MMPEIVFVATPQSLAKRLKSSGTGRPLSCISTKRLMSAPRSFALSRAAIADQVDDQSLNQGAALAFDWPER